MLIVSDERLVDNLVDKLSLACVNWVLRSQEYHEKLLKGFPNSILHSPSAMDLDWKIESCQVQLVYFQVKHALVMEGDRLIDFGHFRSHIVHGLEVVESHLCSAFNVPNRIVEYQIDLINLVDRTLDAMAVFFHIQSFLSSCQQITSALDPKLADGDFGTRERFS